MGSLQVLLLKKKYSTKITVIMLYAHGAAHDTYANHVTVVAGRRPAVVLLLLRPDQADLVPEVILAITAVLLLRPDQADLVPEVILAITTVADLLALDGIVLLVTCRS